MSNPFMDFTTEQRVLNNMKVVARAHLPAYVASTVDAEMMYDHTYQQLALQLRAVVLGERLGDREHHIPFSYPASWWDHFKQDVIFHKHWVPNWLRKRIKPVRSKVETKVIKFEDYRTYPDAPIAIPPERMGQPVIISMQTGGWSDAF